MHKWATGVSASISVSISASKQILQRMLLFSLRSLHEEYRASFINRFCWQSSLWIKNHFVSRASTTENITRDPKNYKMEESTNEIRYKDQDLMKNLCTQGLRLKAEFCKTLGIIRKDLHTFIVPEMFWDSKYEIVKIHKKLRVKE